MDSERYKSVVRWQKIGLSALCVILALVLLVMIFVTAYVHHLAGLISVDPDSTLNSTMSPEDAATATGNEDETDYTGETVHPSDVTIDTLPSDIDLDHDGVVNIMLIGEDRRPGEGRQRSDSMILCSFNTNNNTMTMISFLRDTYVTIPGGYESQKMNAAYQFGGPKLLNEVLAVNFGVHVDASIMVDFDGFRSVIDLLGGVDINLTQKEVDYLNARGYNLTVGMNHLNGDEALTYSRIRKIDMDAMRAQRQRNVLSSLIAAYKGKSLTEMVNIATKILQSGMVTSDMTSQEVINYVVDLFPMLSGMAIKNQQIPASGTYVEQTVGRFTYCKVPDLVANREILSEIMNAK